MTPSAYQSAAAEQACPAPCSGAMYAAVPATPPSANGCLPRGSARHQPEVEDDDASFVRDENVRRLEIAVHFVGGVQRPHAANQLRQRRAQPTHVKPMVLAGARAASGMVGSSLAVGGESSGAPGGRIFDERRAFDKLSREEPVAADREYVIAERDWDQRHPRVRTLA